MTVVSEFTQYITPDGETYDLSAVGNHGRWILSQEGWGTPPFSLLSYRRAQQHSDAFERFFLQPRVVSLLLRHDYVRRQGYWDGRQSLLTAIRPNRQNADPGTLRRVLPDGTVRDLEVYLDRGPGFTPTRGGVWDQWGFTELLRFFAPNPALTDPTLRTDTLSFPSFSELVFPITFPITFGGGLFIDSTNITYAGSWVSFPQIVLTGPMFKPVITNQTGGEVIELAYKIPSGRVVTIELADGVKTVTDDLGTNLYGTVTPESDFETWHLDPAPLAVGGVNTIGIVATGAVPGSTMMEINYYDRYVGM